MTAEVKRWSREELQRAKEEARKLLKTRTAEAPSAAPLEAHAPLEYGPLFRDAAVRSRFRMEDLQGPGVAEAEALHEASISLRERTGIGWRTLSPDVRNGVLRRMTRTEITERTEKDSDDPLQKALRRALDGIAPSDYLKIETGELAALVQIYDGVSAQTKLPPRAELERKLELARLLDPLKAITRTFSGRETELQKLRDYVGVVPPSTLVGKLVRVITAPFTPTRKAPFLLWGPGGVGKTTLTARFILEHALLDEKFQFPFAYLDFDRPTVMANKAATILVEAVRQIGLQYDSAYPASERFRQKWEQELRASTSTDESLERSIADNFVTFLETLEVREGPVLFVLDTFEEVQRRSSAFVTGVIKLVDDLATRVPRLRVVIAGRSEIKIKFGDVEFAFADKQALDQFDRDSATAYLVAHEMNPGAAAEIFEKVGGSPLALTLAIQIYKRDPKDFREQMGFKIDSAELQDEIIQATLFDRILLHIKDPDVQRLAHPGLVLRRVTPELIRDVLAGPCEIDVPDDARAQALFDKLAGEETLVNVEGGVLIHRPDVRKLMLRPLRRDMKTKVEKIHRLAIDYYKKQQGPVARAEEVYHRLSLGEPREMIAPLVTTDMEPLLSGAMDELEPPEHALLAELLGLDVPDDVRRAADDEGWERATARRLSEWTGTRNFDLPAANALLAERSSRSGETDLRLAEAVFFDHAGERDRARMLAAEGIVAYRDAGETDRLFSMLILAATIERKDGQFEPAYARLTEAEEIAKRRRDQPLMLVGVLRERVELLDDSSEELESELRNLSSAAMLVSDADWSGDLTLLRSIVELLGSREPAILGRAIRLGALELGPSAYAFLNTVLSENGIPVKEIRTTLLDLLERGTPPQPVLDALNRVLESEAARREQRQSGRRSEGAAIRLKPAQRETLRDLLTTHYGARLASFVESRFSFALESVSFAEDAPTNAMDVIRAAERQGWLGQLLVSFARARFNNNDVLRFLDSIGFGPEIHETPSMSAKSIRAVVDEYRGRIGALATRTCILTRGGRAIGCAFLTASDRVSTVRSLVDDSSDHYEFFFDSAAYKGKTIDSGISRSPSRRQEQEGFDLVMPVVSIEIDTSLGDQPVEPFASDTSVITRGIVNIEPRAVVPGELLLWLWREHGMTHISAVQQKEARYTTDGRLILQAQSSPLAAGCPIVDARMNVIGVHCGPFEGDPKSSTMLPVANVQRPELATGLFADRHPLVNRMQLRDLLARLARGALRVLVIRGPRRSGKSYSRQFIRRMAEDLGFRMAYVDLTDVPLRGIRAWDVGLKIAEILGLSMPPTLGAPDNESRWLPRFFNWFGYQANSIRTQLWLVFDFDPVALPSPIIDFIHLLVDQIAEERVQSVRCVLIGYERELPPVIEPMLAIENIPPIGEAEIGSYLARLPNIDPPAAAQLSARVVEAMNAHPDDPLSAMNAEISTLLDIQQDH